MDRTYTTFQRWMEPQRFVKDNSSSEDPKLRERRRTLVLHIVDNNVVTTWSIFFEEMTMMMKMATAWMAHTTFQWMAPGC